MNPLLEALMNAAISSDMPMNTGTALLPAKGAKITNKKIQMLLANERILAWRAIHIRRSDKVQAD